MQSDSSVEYRDVEGFPGYRVGDDGSIWSKRGREKLKGRHGGTRPALKKEWFPLGVYCDNCGYRIVVLARSLECGTRQYRTKTVHRLVLEAFIGPCHKGMEACHNNGDCVDNRVENLRWDTRKANAKDRLRHGTNLSEERHPCAKLSKSSVCEIRCLYESGLVKKKRDLARMFGVSESQMGRILRYESWRDACASRLASSHCSSR